MARSATHLVAGAAWRRAEKQAEQAVVVFEVDRLPVDLLGGVARLFVAQHARREEGVQLLVDDVDAKLLEAILRQVLEARHVEDADRLRRPLVTGRPNRGGSQDAAEGTGEGVRTRPSEQGTESWRGRANRGGIQDAAERTEGGVRARPREQGTESGHGRANMGRSHDAAEGTGCGVGARPSEQRRESGRGRGNRGRSQGAAERTGGGVRARPSEQRA